MAHPLIKGLNFTAIIEAQPDWHPPTNQCVRLRSVCRPKPVIADWCSGFGRYMSSSTDSETDSDSTDTEDRR